MSGSFILLVIVIRILYILYNLFHYLHNIKFTISMITILTNKITAKATALICAAYEYYSIGFRRFSAVIS